MDADPPPPPVVEEGPGQEAAALSAAGVAAAERAAARTVEAVELESRRATLQAEVCVGGRGSVASLARERGIVVVRVWWRKFSPVCLNPLCTFSTPVFLLSTSNRSQHLFPRFTPPPNRHGNTMAAGG